MGSTAYEKQLPRIMVEKKKFSEADLGVFGFKPTILSIPEPGQARLTSWRHPEGYHVHDHDSNWVFHKDKHPVDIESPLSTARHIMFEGVTGAKNYIKHKLYDNRSVLEVLKKQKLPQFPA